MVAIPDATEVEAAAWFGAFSGHYYARFSAEELLTHARAFIAVRRGQPFVTLFDHRGEAAEVTIVAPNWAGEFTLLVGLLGISGFTIDEGDIFTSLVGREDSQAMKEESHEVHRRPRLDASHRRARRQIARPQSPTQQRIIIDRFRGRPLSGYDTWRQRLQSLLEDLFETRHANDIDRWVAEEVAAAIRRSSIPTSTSLMPASIEFEQSDPAVTRFTIIGEDTPFFLYTFSVALGFHRVQIDHVHIRTHKKMVMDTFEITDLGGAPIRQQKKLDQIRLTALLTKQFTYFFHSAPDPYRALERFELLVQDFQELSRMGRFSYLLTSPQLLRDLARLLGTSDFLWEDFMHHQYEAIIPLIAPGEEGALRSKEPEEMRRTLRRTIDHAKDYEEARRRLNDFKNNETYMIDMDHILRRDLDFFFLSSRLTYLAEGVVEEALHLADGRLRERFGTPRTAGALAAECAVMGLGKFGGGALGYASDIELLFVYNDNGATDGAQSIANSEYFERLVRETTSLIETKREGIFHTDLRLRPHGAAGALAVGLGDFVAYYRRQAVSLELLSLVRMRWVAGSRSLGRQIEAIRDSLVYAGDGIDLEELRRLRRQQQAQIENDGRMNVKHSSGGLSDLEHCVQILQVELGLREPKLRTPRIHQALDVLAEAGRIDSRDADRLKRAYRFLRSLINGLRMLRGNARDLYLPEMDALEFLHLARRMKYVEANEHSPAERLRIDFETTTAYIRSFVDRQLQGGLSERSISSVADIILSEQPLPADRRARFEALLQSNGFHNPKRGVSNLLSMAGEEGGGGGGGILSEERLSVAEVAIMAWQTLIESPDPDMAMNNWERFCTALPDRRAHFRQLGRQPRRLEILIHIMAGSQFLADILIHNPDFFDWVTSPHTVDTPPGIDGLRLAFGRFGLQFPSKSWLDRMRHFRKREILRIGARDICLGANLIAVTADLSDLATVIIRAALAHIEDELGIDESLRSRFCILGFGKLGGCELNYSSDLDLVALFDPLERGGQQIFSHLMGRLRDDLSTHTDEGYAYRIDLRLRPYGTAGMLAYPTDALWRYYDQQALPWEHQALLKASPIVGNLRLGERFRANMLRHLMRRWDAAGVCRSIRGLRAVSRGRAVGSHNIKEGAGGIRDIEFLVQGLQMIHCRRHPDLLISNTLNAIERLRGHGIVSQQDYESLRRDYIFLRRIEHFLQILDDRRVHSLPVDPESLASLARRMRRADGFREDFFDLLETTMERVLDRFDHYLPEPQST